MVASIYASQMFKQGSANVWRPFNMLVGNDPDGYTGYRDGDRAPPPVGSISQQPNPAHILIAFLIPDSGVLGAYFEGDLSAVMATLDAVVDGNTYPPTSYQVLVDPDSGGTYTVIEYEVFPSLTVGQTYSCSFTVEI